MGVAVPEQSTPVHVLRRTMCRADVISTSARNEFEQARFERDPQLVSRCLGLLRQGAAEWCLVQISQLLVTGRDCVDQTVQKARLEWRCSLRGRVLTICKHADEGEAAGAVATRQGRKLRWLALHAGVLWHMIQLRIGL